MLQTCDVGFCVEEGRRAPDVECCTQHGSCCTQHGSQHGRNIVATWGNGRKTSDVGCCT
jgi:hypothetical protein